MNTFHMSHCCVFYLNPHCILCCDGHWVYLSQKHTVWREGGGSWYQINHSQPPIISDTLVNWNGDGWRYLFPGNRLPRQCRKRPLFFVLFMGKPLFLSQIVQKIHNLAQIKCNTGLGGVCCQRFRYVGLCGGWWGNFAATNNPTILCSDV